MTEQYAIIQPRPPEPATVPPAEPVYAPTRHLSAAAYLDEEFRDRALRETYDQPRRAIAPSYGFDLAIVLAHCRRARSMAVARDALLVGIPLVVLCVSPLAVVSAVSWLIGIAIGMAGLRLARDAAVELRSGELAVNRLRARGLMLLLGVAAWLIFGFLLWVAAASAVVAQANTFGYGDDGLGAGQASSALEVLFSVAVAGAALLLCFWAAIGVGDRLLRQAALERLAPGRPATPATDTPRMREIQAQERGNTTIYSGYQPFVGSGELLNTWGFAQRLIRPEQLSADRTPEAEREYEVLPFSAVELKDDVAAKLRTLTGADGNSPELSLPGLAVSDRVFIHGTRALGVDSHTRPEQMERIVRDPTDAFRHYLTSQVVAWSGEVVATVYTHFAVQGRSLYLEMSTWALPPCDERYRVADTIDGTGPGAFLRGVWQGLAGTPGTVGRAPINLVKALAAVIARSVGGSSAAGIDRGARVSVRELASADDAANYMQIHDIVKYTRIVERRILALVFDFLEARGIDTAEYRQRALTVLNYGLMPMGGTTTVNGSAFGQYSTVNNAGQQAGV